MWVRLHRSEGAALFLGAVAQWQSSGDFQSSRFAAAPFSAWQSTALHPPLRCMGLLGIFSTSGFTSLVTNGSMPPLTPAALPRKTRPSGQGEAGRGGVGRERAQLTTADGPLQKIGINAAPRAGVQTRASAKCCCHLVLPSSSCTQQHTRVSPSRAPRARSSVLLSACPHHPWDVCEAPQALQDCGRMSEGEFSALEGGVGGC